MSHEADMRFVGQTHVLTVPIPRTDFESEDLTRAFERAYWERFEVELREMRAQVVSLRTAVIGRRRTVSLDGLIALEVAATGAAPRPEAPAAGVVRGRVARHPGVPARAARRRRRGSTGPAIVEQLDTTTVIEPGDRVRVDRLGNLEITVRAIGG